MNQKLDRRRARREGGMALLVAMMMLALMGILALSSLETVMRDRQVAGSQTQSRTALYAAEAGIARAMAILRTAPPDTGGGLAALNSYAPSFPQYGTPETVGTGSFQPSFSADQGHAGIAYLASGGKCWEDDLQGAMAENIGGGNPIWRDALWEVRVQGQSVNGTKQVVQSVVTTCHPYDS